MPETRLAFWPTRCLLRYKAVRTDPRVALSRDSEAGGGPPIASLRRRMNDAQSVTLLLLCADADRTIRDELMKHLAGLESSGVVRIVHTGIIEPGANYNVEVDRYVEEAHVIVLLVSADLLASGQFLRARLSQAMARHERGDAIVVPVIARSCDWESEPFATLRPLPSSGVLSPAHSNVDEAYREVAKSLRALAQKRRPTVGQKRPAPRFAPTDRPSAPMFGAGGVLLLATLALPTDAQKSSASSVSEERSQDSVPAPRASQPVALTKGSAPTRSIESTGSAESSSPVESSPVGASRAAKASPSSKRAAGVGSAAAPPRPTIEPTSAPSVSAVPGMQAAVGPTPDRGPSAKYRFDNVKIGADATVGLCNNSKPDLDCQARNVEVGARAVFIAGSDEGPRETVKIPGDAGVDQ